MSQERRQDYDTVINDVAILTGCKDANDERWVYMEKYDGHTRSFENVALKAGEEYSGEKNLQTLSNNTAIVIYQLIILNLVHLSLEYAVNTNVIKPIQKLPSDDPLSCLARITSYKIELAWRILREKERNGEAWPTIEEMKALPSDDPLSCLATTSHYKTKLAWQIVRRMEANREPLLTIMQLENLPCDDPLRILSKLKGYKDKLKEIESRNNEKLISKITNEPYVERLLIWYVSTMHYACIIGVNHEWPEQRKEEERKAAE
eukprot:scaffold61585_cov47-Cyclotella_meneghiniana.AAC.1